MMLFDPRYKIILSHETTLSLISNVRMRSVTPFIFFVPVNFYATAGKKWTDKD